MLLPDYVPHGSDQQPALLVGYLDVLLKHIHLHDPGDHQNFGMIGKPLSKGSGSSVGENIDGAARFEIQEDGSVPFASAITPIIDTKNPYGLSRSFRLSFDQA